MSTIVSFNRLRVTGTALIAALLSVAVPEENALAAVWNVKLDATCSPAANYCRASAAVIPAGYELTIRHISCELTTAPEDVTEKPL